jgi:thiol-disulfide isomerase/thioredoxin
MRRVAGVAFVLGVVALLTAVALRVGAPTPDAHAEHELDPAMGPTHARMAATYAAPTLDGDTIALADLRGSVLVVNLWATWCHPCVKELPSLERLQASLEGEGLRVLAINVDRLPETRAAEEVARFLDRIGVELTVLLDPAGRAETVFGAMGLPTTLVIGRDGRLAYRRLGAGDWDLPPLRDHVVAALQR